MNNAEPDIFHQSIKLFETQKLEFGRSAAEVLTRQGRLEPRSVQITRIVGGEHRNTGPRPNFLSDDITQSADKGPISTAVRMGKSNGSSGFGSQGPRDAAPTGRSLLGTRAAQSVATSVSSTSFPESGGVVRTASGHPTTRTGHVVVDSKSGSQFANIIESDSKRIEHNPVVNSVDTTVSEFHQPLPDAVIIAPMPAVREPDHDRQLSSSNASRSPTWIPRVVPFLTPGIGDHGSRLPAAMREARLMTAKSDVPTALSKVNAEASRTSESALAGNTTNNTSPDTPVSAELRRDPIGISDDADQVKDSSQVTGELWLDTVSLRNWFQAYLAGEIARGSRTTNLSHTTF
jgi:hypothetical protein